MNNEDSEEFLDDFKRPDWYKEFIKNAQAIRNSQPFLNRPIKKVKIDLLIKRSYRDEIISEDDILNLKICLFTTNDINEFINQI